MNIGNELTNMEHLKLTKFKVLKMFPEFHSEKEKHDLLDIYTVSCRTISEHQFEFDSPETIDLFIDKIIAMGGCRGSYDIKVFRTMLNDSCLSNEQESKIQEYIRNFK
jgi:hypothetical protein